MKQISRAAVIWQLVAFFATIGPHLSWMPIWLIAMCILTPGIRLMIYTGRWPLPHWALKLALIVAVIAGLMVTFTQESGMRATVALLVAGLALKLIEIYHRRDALVLLYVSLFLAGTVFLFHQSILTALYALVTVVFIIAALNSSYQDPLRTDLMRPLKRSVRLVGFSLPLMLVLFVVFPRIGPLWSVPLDQQAARSGLSDSMSPGDISQLTRSAELAFRVSFDDRVPAPEQRYWRSMVYGNFDGRTWSRTPFREQYRMSPVELIDRRQEVSYEVVYEASNNRWLVALDQPVTAPAGSQLTRGNAPIRSRPVDRRISYRAVSVLDYTLQPALNAYDLQVYRRLPVDGSNARSVALARRWWQESQQQPKRFVQLALNLFSREFVYTLSPPALSGDRIDAFLFESKQGFCGHYAGALTYLLRSVGVPARVVAGYQGGEWNAEEAYLTVRQYDAHAWVEYWIEGEGWLRVDPTAAVAPERVRDQADRLFADDPAFLSDTPLARLRFGQDSWLVDMRRQIEALNFNWQRWVLNYQGQQMELLRGLLGDVSMTRIALFLMLPIAAVLLIVAWLQLGGSLFRRQDALERSLTRLLNRFDRLGYGREPQESLQAFSRRVSIAFPAMEGELRALARCDEAMRYANRPGSRKALLAATRACYRALKQTRTIPEREQRT